MNEKPPVNPWLIAVSVMLATFMEVLDTSIANVALEHIAGSLSVSTSESTWVLTTYLISNAIVIPSTAWFGQRFGRKRFLMFCVAVFTGASLFCGLSTSLPMLLLMRAIQGAGGGALQPIAQAILLETFPKEKHGQAIGVYGLGIVVAPALGPVLGGWITDNYTWRWIFFINVPVGILALALMHLFISDPRWIRDAKAPRLDLMGFGFMSLWLGCQEVVLDKGQEDDWFGSHFIVLMTSLAAVGFVVFLIRVLSAAKPFVDLRVLKNYNFSLGTSLMFFQGLMLYGLIAAIPLFMQTLLGYTALTSGVAMLPRGLGSILAMPIAGKLVNKLPGRYLVAGGFFGFAASSFLLSRIDLDISPHVLVWPLFFNGASIAFFFVPLNSLALGALRPDQISNASGIFNLMRNVGGSVGISIVTTLADRRAQVHQTFLAGHLTPYDAAYQARLLGMSSMLAHQSGTVDGHQQALGEIGKILIGQASLLAYVDVFLVFAGLCGLCAAGALFMKNIKAAGPVMAH
jgi:DHA2 family multidrug resistance protein